MTSMAVAAQFLDWLGILEKEFDRSFVDLDVNLGQAVTDAKLLEQCRGLLNNMSTSFVQMAIKSQAIFQSNTKAEAHILSMKSDLENVTAEKLFAEGEMHNLVLQLHASQLKLLKVMGQDVSSDNIQRTMESQIKARKRQFITEERLTAAVGILEKENTTLKKYISALQSEVYVSRTAARYLDKELAGRMQQIQLLCQKLDGPAHDRIWNTLESEILLHRHKTVIRASRGRCSKFSRTGNIHRDLCNKARRVSVVRSNSDGLGISVTGGLEHGVPIMISEVLPGQLAHENGNFLVGDAILGVNGIDLRDKRHSEAVEVLSAQQGRIVFDLLFIAADDSDSDNEILEDESGNLFRLYDERKLLPSRFLFQVQKKAQKLRHHSGSSRDPSSQIGLHNDLIADNASALQQAAEYRSYLESQHEKQQRQADLMHAQLSANRHTTASAESEASVPNTDRTAMSRGRQLPPGPSPYEFYTWLPKTAPAELQKKTDTMAAKSSVSSASELRNAASTPPPTATANNHAAIAVASGGRRLAADIIQHRLPSPSDSTTADPKSHSTLPH